jgi:hypothetical protein
LLPDEAASVACDVGRLGAVRYNAANDEFAGCFANDGAPQWAAIGAAAAPAPALLAQDPDPETQARY